MNRHNGYIAPIFKHYIISLNQRGLYNHCDFPKYFGNYSHIFGREGCVKSLTLEVISEVSPHLIY